MMSTRDDGSVRSPQLSVVLPTDSWETIRPVVECLRAQTVRADLELIFATPDPEGLARAAGAALAEFNWKTVPTSLESLHEARAVAVQHATTRYVFLGETHTYPHPGWAEAVLLGHQTWDVVVPSFDNANPERSLSWGAFLGDYGLWSGGLEEGEVQWWPSTNASYPCSLLRELGGDLETLLERAGQMWEEVHARGLRAGFVPGARIDHANVATPWAWVWERYLAGLVIGGHRGTRWPLVRRVVYAGGGPLLVPLLMKRSYPAVRRARGRTRLPAGATVAWAVGIVIRAWGESVGYLRGVSGANRARMNEYEIHKIRHSGL